MCPLNMSDFPPPAPSQRPTTFGRPSSTSCHWTWSPMPASSSRTRSPIACSSPVGLEIDTRSTASATSRSASISTEMWQHLFAEELEHDVRAARVAVLLDRRNAVGGSAGDRLALVEDLVRHLRLGSEPSTLLHRLGDRSNLLLCQACKIEQRVRRPLDVLHLVCEVHAGDLTSAVATGLSIRLVDRRDDRAADVDVRSDVLARVA